MRIRYIPAGLTGKYQINDTYFHGPYKKWVRSEAEVWFQGKFINMLARLDSGALSKELMADEMKKMLGVANLRNLAIEWNCNAILKLGDTDILGVSLVSKGWLDVATYGQIFDEDFQRSAQQRMNGRSITAAAIDDEVYLYDLRELAEKQHVDPELPDIQFSERKTAIEQKEEKNKGRKTSKKGEK
jgi:hypothetical protein